MVESLAQIARSAVIWNAGFNLFRDLLQFGMMLVLVRLLEPEAYGQFGLVTSLIGFVSIFSFNNFIAHSLQVKTDEEADFQSHFTAGALLQPGMFLVTNLVAFALRWIPSYAPVAPFVHVMSLTFLLEWPCEVRRKMIERSFDWRTLRILHGVGLLGSTALSIFLALMGAGAFALLLPALMVTLPFVYDLFIRQGWRPTWQWNWETYKAAWRFGLMRMGSGITLAGRQLLESGVLTAVLGFTALGVLNRSLGLAQLFCLKVATQLIYAIYPILTRIDAGGGNAERAGGLIFRVVIWLVLPVAICFGVLARPVVQVVYGDKWGEVIPLLPWAMAWGAMAAVVHAGYMLLLARQQQRKCLLADVLILAGTGLSLWLVLPHGVQAYLRANVGLQVLVAAVLVFWLRGCQAVTVRGLADALGPAGVAAALAGFGASALFRWGLDLTPDTFWRALLWSCIFIGIYGAILRVAFVRQLSGLICYFPASKPIRRLLAIRSVT